MVVLGMTQRLLFFKLRRQWFGDVTATARASSGATPRWKPTDVKD